MSNLRLFHAIQYNIRSGEFCIVHKDKWDEPWQAQGDQMFAGKDLKLVILELSGISGRPFITLGEEGITMVIRA